MTSHDFNATRKIFAMSENLFLRAKKASGKNTDFCRLEPKSSFFSICPSLFPLPVLYWYVSGAAPPDEGGLGNFCNPQISKWFVYGCLAWFREFLSFTFCVSFLPWEQMQNNSLLTWNKHLSILKYYFVVAGRTENEKKRIFFQNQNSKTYFKVENPFSKEIKANAHNLDFIWYYAFQLNQCNAVLKRQNEELFMIFFLFCFHRCSPRLITNWSREK